MTATNIHPHSAVAAGTNADALRDIKPPVEIPNGWAWVWWVGLVLVIAALAFWAWRYWQKRRAQAQVIPVVPAHIRAKQTLREMLRLIGQPRQFCILLSDVIRWYLEERFDFHAPERTTEEFLHELQRTNLLTPDQKGSLGEFLQRCDLVKFARYEPGEPELRALHDSALRLVEETEPIMATLQAVKSQGSATGLSIREPLSANGPMTTPPQSSASKARRFAVIGALLQLAPCIWVFAYLITMLRLLRLMGSPRPFDPGLGFAGFTELAGEIRSILGSYMILLVIGLVLGIVGLILLIFTLTSLRYRAEWFFWFLLVYSVVLLTAFPFGTAVSVFFIVYCLPRRGEFLNRQDGTVSP